MNSPRSLFIPIEKVMFSEGKEKETRGADELIQIRRTRSIALYHGTSTTTIVNVKLGTFFL